MTLEKTKDETYFHICNAVLKLEVSNGHLDWTISDVARESGVTRSLIYYYLGKQKETILKEAYKFMLDFFYGPVELRFPDLNERLKSILQLVEKMPYLFVLFFIEKNKDTELGHLIRDAELELMDLYAKDYPDLKPLERKLVYVFMLGAVAYKDLTSDEIATVFKKLTMAL